MMKLDGKEHPILRSNYLLRAALIPAGDHEIMMRYEPRIWKIGGTISFISSLVILLVPIFILAFAGAYVTSVFSYRKHEGDDHGS